MNLQDASNVDVSADMPEFSEFYGAINQRRTPFPWQSRLARQLTPATGRWNAEIGIPTGLGKTACLDIAVWWLAKQADCAPAQRTAPTRIWWVVNRRLLVDSTFKHAEHIKKALSDPKSLKCPSDQEVTNSAVKNACSTDAPCKECLRNQEFIKIVADRLRSIAGSPNAEPLEVIRLHGGIASHRPTCPSQPAILLTTLPMYGSRLLFRGYGSSQAMRSIDAAMAGTDSLVLLDEAHLTPHLSSLLSATSQCAPHVNPILNEDRLKPVLVELTATGNKDNQNRFILDDEDRKHREIKKRLDAVKPLELRVIEAKKTDISLAQATQDILKNVLLPATCLVFANTPKTARKTFSLLKKQMKNSKVLLLTGRMREREAERVRQQVLGILGSRHEMPASYDTSSERKNHLIVVATQTLEVGADIDAEYLVTEQCGVRALIQRLGRLNRMGRFKYARAVYVHMPVVVPRSKGGIESNSDVWPIYGKEPKDVLERLQGLENTSGEINLSPRCVAEVLGAPGDDPGRAPELLSGILWEWMKTSAPPQGEAPVEPYFSGIQGTQKLVTIFWRAHIPKEGQRLWPRASDRETIDIPISEAREVLKNDLKDDGVIRLDPNGVTVEKSSRLRPGDQIVLRTDRGLMDEFGWNPDTTETVMDMSLIGHGLPLDAEAIRRICDISIKQEDLNTALNISDDDTEIEPEDQVHTLKTILNAIRQKIPPHWGSEEWDKFVSSLNVQTGAVYSDKEVPRLRVKKAKPEIPSDDFDETSLSDIPVKLEPHCEAVAAFAESVCDRIGLPPDLIKVVKHAGRLHDIGKADQRFQRWLSSEWSQNGILLAKSNTPRHQWESRRKAAGWPRGGRHEALSARMALAWLNNHPDWGDSVMRELLIHLVISHHGKGRPLIMPAADNTSPTEEGVVLGERVIFSADLGIVDWKQPSRFRRLNQYFGPWGLALLEAILRLSDHAVSAEANMTPNQKQ